MLSGGNFHGQAVALALDVLAIALTNLGVMSERRIDRLVHPDLNQGLPPFLTSDAGVSSGYMMAQVTAAALASECKVLSHPASVDSIPTDGSKEDVVPMAMGAAWKLRRVVHNVQHILAIELLCAMQGIDYRRPLRAGTGVERAYREVRALVPDPSRGPGFWFVTVNRSRSDGLSGFAGFFVRRRVRSEVQTGALAALRSTKQRVENMSSR